MFPEWTRIVITALAFSFALIPTACEKGRVCTAHLKIHLPEPNPLTGNPKAEGVQVIIERDGVEVFNHPVNLVGELEGQAIEVIGQEDRPPTIEASSSFLVKLAAFCVNCDPRTIVAVGRSAEFACQADDQPMIPVYLGPANGFGRLSAEVGERINATVSSMGNGYVLIVGGQDLDENPASPTALVYDHEFGEVCGPDQADCLVGDPPMARVDHTATIMADDSVLIVGGRRPGTQELLSDVVLFDSETDSFTRFDLPTSARRSQHAAVFLEEGIVPSQMAGRVLVIGGLGGDDLSDALATMVMIDPVEGSVETLDATLSTPRCDATASLLDSGEVLIAGGRDQSGEPLDSAELFNTDTGTCSTIDSHLCARRAGHTATKLRNDDWLLWGGEVLPADGDSPRAEVFMADRLLFLPASEDAHTLAHRSGHTATSVDCQDVRCPVLVVGGEALDDTVPPPMLYEYPEFDRDSLEGFYPGTTTEFSRESAKASRVFHGAAPLFDGTVLVVGGQDSDGRSFPQAAAFSPCVEVHFNAGGLLACPDP